MDLAWLGDDARIRRLGRADAAPIVWTDSSVTDVGAAEIWHGAHRVACWSGSFAQTQGGGLFEADPRTWSAKGWAAFEAACATLGRRSEPPGPELWIRTHARHVLSDVPSCARFLGSVDASETRQCLLLDPASMLTPQMLAAKSVEDHLRRRYQAIEIPAMEQHGRGVVVANAAPDAEAGVRACGLFEGVLPPEMIAGVARPYIEAGTPAVLLGADPERQARLLA